jgi:hypothetical protein
VDARSTANDAAAVDNKEQMSEKQSHLKTGSCQSYRPEQRSSPSPGRKVPQDQFRHWRAAGRGWIGEAGSPDGESGNPGVFNKNDDVGIARLASSWHH